MRYNKRKPYVMVLLLLSFPLAITLQRSYVYFIQLKNETISLTSIGFAMMMGLASVLFNWARSIDADIYRDAYRRINKMAAQTLLTGLMFLLSSIFKLVSTYESMDPLVAKSNEVPDYWVYGVSSALILLALMALYLIIGEFIIVFIYLWKHIYNFKSSEMDGEINPDPIVEEK
ncbi:hypothetical protein [Pedobacter panaciterrae]